MKITTKVNWGKNTEETREKLKEEHNSEQNKETLKKHLQRKLAKAVEVKKIINYTEEEEGDTLWVTFNIEYEDEVEEETAVTNDHLNRAMHVRNDEFYTLYDDVEYELKHYHDQLRDQVIYLPADGAEYSNFWKYLVTNYEKIKYKKIICTSVSLYNHEKTTFDGKETTTVAHHSGNFQDNIKLFKEVDVVITNPPFSTIGDFTKILLDNNLKYIFVGPLTLVLRDHTFAELKLGKMKAIDTVLKRFVNPEGKIKAVAALWYTNLERKEFDKKTNNDELTPKTLYYYGTNTPYLKRLDDLNNWKDYQGEMAVPVTIFQKLYKYNVEIIRIIGNREITKATDRPELKKFLRGKEVTNNKIPPIIKTDRPRENQQYWVHQTTGEKYAQPFARILVKWRK